MLCAFRLARRFEEEGIEHIHAPWASGPATAAWICSRLTGIPFSFTARAWDIYPPDSLIREKIRDAALVRSETRFNIRHLARWVGEEAQKIRVTYNGVPLRVDTLAHVPMRSPYRLLALGRFVPKKGYHYLLRACRVLLDSGLDIHLTLAGDGPLNRELQRTAREHGLTDQVSFPGFVPHDRVGELLGAADIFIMPSVVDSRGDRDGIPTVVLEALAHRIPVIASRISGIPELIQDGVTGLLVPERDSPAIAEAVQRLVGDRSRALEMAERGRQEVLRRFDSAQNLPNVIALYRELTALHREALVCPVISPGRTKGLEA
jgi:glycosyltransferase involved in cell wall biosynthesis